MPSRNRHREKTKGLKTSSDWTKMLSETDVHERLSRDHPRVVVVLDHLAGQVTPYSGHGWTVFNDWLDAAYGKHFAKRPDSMPIVSIDAIREAIFPACKL